MATALPVVGVPLTSDLLVRAVAVLAPALGEVDTGAQPTVEVPAVEEPKPEPLVMTAEEFVERNARSLAEVDAQQESGPLPGVGPVSARSGGPAAPTLNAGGLNPTSPRAPRRSASPCPSARTSRRPSSPTKSCVPYLSAPSFSSRSVSVSGS